jgi:hypothetical protein
VPHEHHGVAVGEERAIAGDPGIGLRPVSALDDLDLYDLGRDAERHDLLRGSGGDLRGPLLQAVVDDNGRHGQLGQLLDPAGAPGGTGGQRQGVCTAGDPDDDALYGPWRSRPSSRKAVGDDVTQQRPYRLRHP